MSESEYIVWKCETIMDIRKKYPEWSDEQVRRYFMKVKERLEETGFFD